MDTSKPHVQVFILFPEPEPKQFYLKRFVEHQSEKHLATYISKISLCKNLIEIENYFGFYDDDNVKEFIQYFEILEEFYPTRPSSLLRSQLKGWFNWRDQRFSMEKFESKLFDIPISNETFTEIVVRSALENIHKHIVISHNALKIKTSLIYEVLYLGHSYQVECIELSNLPTWFNNNRIPRRNYHPSSKHGENGMGEHSGASKLLCNHTCATEMLHKALGNDEIDELYFFDEQYNKFIIFRYEGDNPLNQFHAYHLNNDNDVPKSVKVLYSKLLELVKND